MTKDYLLSTVYCLLTSAPETSQGRMTMYLAAQDTPMILMSHVDMFRRDIRTGESYKSDLPELIIYWD